jgi:hypothetical protein
MLEGEMPLLDIDDLAMAASDLLDQFRDRGMNDPIQRTEGLIAKFKAAIQAHDAKVAAAQAALEAREFMHHIDHIDESFALPSCSTEMTSSCATQSNTEGSCTITISHTQRKELSHHQKKKVQLCWLRLEARRDCSLQCGCMLTEFRLFAFETGWQYLQAGTLEHIKLATVIKAFEELHPDSPASLKSSITVDDWKKAVRANNIDMITLGACLK